MKKYMIFMLISIVAITSATDMASKASAVGLESSGLRVSFLICDPVLGIFASPSVRVPSAYSATR